MNKSKIEDPEYRRAIGRKKRRSNIKRLQKKIRGTKVKDKRTGEIKKYDLSLNLTSNDSYLVEHEQLWELFLLYDYARYCSSRINASIIRIGNVKEKKIYDTVKRYASEIENSFARFYLILHELDKNGNEIKLERRRNLQGKLKMRQVEER